MTDDYRTLQKRAVEELRHSLRQGQQRTSIVQMRSHYADDAELSLTAVTFPPRSVVEAVLKSVIQPLAAIEPDHYYYPGDFLHFTIKNVRVMHNPPKFTEADIAKANHLFQRIIPTFPPFTFRLEEAIVLPTSVALIAYSSATFGQLVQALDSGLKQIGLPDDKHYISDTVFFGNMTVCRFTHPPSLAFKETVNALNCAQIAEIPVNEISLVTCNSVCNANTRTVIETYSLNG